jgi:hypothetical protein
LVPTDRFRFGYFISKIKTQPIGFGSIWFGLVWFGYFILKIKNYIIFWDFFGLSDGFQF